MRRNINSFTRIQIYAICGQYFQSMFDMKQKFPHIDDAKRDRCVMCS